MSEPEKSTRRFVVDTNVFVAAIKPFAKPGQESHEYTKTLTLLVKLIVNDRLELFGNSRLMDEYRRLSQELDSETSSLILRQLMGKMKIVEVDEKTLMRCKPYLPAEETADLVHAATTLQNGAILITNDRDFDRIGQSGIIKAWSISEAIRRLLRNE